MKINKYWVKQKRHNRTYKKSLTKYQTEKSRKQNLRIVVAFFASITIGMLIELAATTNSMEFNGGLVAEQSNTRPPVEPSLGEDLNLHSSSPGMVREITAYSEYDSCHYPAEGGCLTASGKIAKEGMAASNLYPFGTKLIIGGREFTVEDRISKRYNNRIDIFMGYGEDGSQKAKEWGLKKLSVITKK